MMDCLIVGDSIAVGVSQLRPECVSLSKSGLTSKSWNVSYMNRPFFDMMEYNTAIISLGTNDSTNTETEEHLTELRETVKAKTVFWIMPAINEHAQKMILKIARNNGDRIVYIKDLSNDKVHPSANGYKWLAYETR